MSNLDRIVVRLFHFLSGFLSVFFLKNCVSLNIWLIFSIFVFLFSEDIFEEDICGRPLGLKFDNAGNLYVADAYYGIFKYNIAKGVLNK